MIGNFVKLFVDLLSPLFRVCELCFGRLRWHLIKCFRLILRDSNHRVSVRMGICVFPNRNIHGLKEWMTNRTDRRRSPTVFPCLTKLKLPVIWEFWAPHKSSRPIVEHEHCPQHYCLSIELSFVSCRIKPCQITGIGNGNDTSSRLHSVDHGALYCRPLWRPFEPSPVKISGESVQKMSCHAIILHGHNGCTTLFMRRPQAENAINERGSLQDKRDRTYSHHHSE